eukprot:COSAG02_NODE_13083_length_1448_cov_1.670867_1_plen_151_part_00
MYTVVLEPIAHHMQGSPGKNQGAPLYIQNVHSWCKRSGTLHIRCALGTKTTVEIEMALVREKKKMQAIGDPDRVAPDEWRRAPGVAFYSSFGESGENHKPSAFIPSRLFGFSHQLQSCGSVRQVFWVQNQSQFDCCFEDIHIGLVPTSGA